MKCEYNLYLLIFKILLIFTDKIGLAENIFYILTYPITAVTMLVILRKFEIKQEIALAGSILYSFLPYHFLRNEMHLFFATYIFIPLVSYGIILLFNNNFEDADTVTFRIMNKSLLKRNNLISVIGCILLGASDIYNSFFAAIIICFAGMVSTIKYKKKRNLYYMSILLLALTIPLFINVMPALMNRTNSDISQFANNRNLNDVDRYGLRISQLLMPITGHRLPVLADLREQYDSAGFSNLLESNMNSLGIFMSLGFIIGLLGLIFWKREKSVLSAAAEINIFVVLLAGIGGLNIFIAIFFTYYIRTYCRIVVFIAAFSNIIICICLSKLMDYFILKNNVIMKKLYIRIMICIGMIILGVLDQTSSDYATGTDFDYVCNWDGTLDELEKKWKNDEQFIHEIEEVCSDRAMIFQMPILSYTELQTNVFENGLPHTDRFLRPYLHSHSLFWSYPLVNGADSYAALWNTSMQQLTVKKQVEALILAGFEGIYIDKYSMSDKQADYLVCQLSIILQEKPIISEKRDLLFFHLKKYADKMKIKLTEKEWTDRKMYWLFEYYPRKQRMKVQKKDLHFIGKISKDEGRIFLFPDALQFGPYINLEKGIYDITISGDHFNENCLVRCTSDLGDTEIKVKNLEITERSIRYRIILDQDMTNVEFLLENKTNKKIFINSIHYAKKNLKKEYNIQKKENIMYFLEDKFEKKESLDLIPGKYIIEIFGDNLENVEFVFNSIDENGEVVQMSGRKIFSTPDVACIYLNIGSDISISNFSCLEKEVSNINRVKIFSK